MNKTSEITMVARTAKKYSHPRMEILNKDQFSIKEKINQKIVEYFSEFKIIFLYMFIFVDNYRLFKSILV